MPFSLRGSLRLRCGAVRKDRGRALTFAPAHEVRMWGYSTKCDEEERRTREEVCTACGSHARRSTYLPPYPRSTLTDAGAMSRIRQ